MSNAEFGTFAAHQPNYDGFKQLGKLDDFVFQSLAHMGNASHHMSWALTVLDELEDSRDQVEGIQGCIRAIQEAIHETTDVLRDWGSQHKKERADG